jgi:hypothetical protein
MLLALADRLGDAIPGPRPRRVTVLTVENGKKLSDFSGINTVTALEYGGHLLHLGRRRGNAVIGMPSCCHIEPLASLCGQGSKIGANWRNWPFVPDLHNSRRSPRCVKDAAQQIGHRWRGAETADRGSGMPSALSRSLRALAAGIALAMNPAFIATVPAGEPRVIEVQGENRADPPAAREAPSSGPQNIRPNAEPAPGRRAPEAARPPGRQQDEGAAEQEGPGCRDTGRKLELIV